MITVTIRKTGVLRRAWRMTIQGGNGEKLPHAYNSLESALKTAHLMFGVDADGKYEPVQLRVLNETGGVSM